MKERRLQEKIRKNLELVERSRQQIQSSRSLSASGKRRAQETRALVEWLRESVLPQSRRERRSEERD